jgi:hypothetical protein
MKLYAIISESCCSGENDSTEHLMIPDGMDLGEEKKAWDKWYGEVYCSQDVYPVAIKYMDFIVWLKSHGAVYPSGDQLSEFRY